MGIAGALGKVAGALWEIAGALWEKMQTCCRKF